MHVATLRLRAAVQLAPAFVCALRLSSRSRCATAPLLCLPSAKWHSCHFHASNTSALVVSAGTSAHSPWHRSQSPKWVLCATGDYHHGGQDISGYCGRICDPPLRLCSRLLRQCVSCCLQLSNETSPLNVCTIPEYGTRSSATEFPQH